MFLYISNETALTGFKERREMSFKCTKCGISYKRKRSLDHHTKNECGVVFHCTLCKHNLATKCSLRNHLLGVHQISRRKLDKYGAGIKHFLFFIIQFCTKIIHVQDSKIDPGFLTSVINADALTRENIHWHAT